MRTEENHTERYLVGLTRKISYTVYSTVHCSEEMSLGRLPKDKVNNLFDFTIET